MQRKIFIIKLINGDNNLILTIDYTELSHNRACWLSSNPVPIKVEPDKNCKLLFIGKENSSLTLEDIYNLSGLFQSIIGKTLVWDIIGNRLNQEDSQDLDGYLIM